MIHIAGNVYVIPGTVNVGVYIIDSHECILIDTGLDDQSAKSINKELKSMNLVPKVIINTHSHADHIGGNHWLQQQTNSAIASSAIEKAIIEQPLYEPIYLYGGLPPVELKSKFFMAKPSQVNHTLSFDEEFYDLKIINLTGHALGQLGVISPEGVMFTADAYFPKNILGKYYIPYYFDVAQGIKTLETLNQSHASFYIPGHGPIESDIKEIISENRQRLIDIKAKITFYLGLNPMSREQIMAHFMQAYSIPNNIGQYYLSSATIVSTLNMMVASGELNNKFEDGFLKWERVD